MSAEGTMSKELGCVDVPIPGGMAKIKVNAGVPVFIFGCNGTGKSALVNHLARELKEKAIYFSGSRPSYFENENLSMTPESRRQFDQSSEGWLYDHSMIKRWKPGRGTSRNEKAVYDLCASENQYKNDKIEQIKRDGKDSPVIFELQGENSPLDRVNALLRQANMAVQIKIDGMGLKARRADSVYSYARMSDGERAAFVIASDVMAAKPGAIFLLDEPELHLHPSIVVVLIKSLIDARPDCGFIISTHQLELPVGIHGGKIILMRGISWENENFPECDMDIIDGFSDIPEWLWVDVVGSRKKILFIEGDAGRSLDQSLYGLIFPEISIRARGSCKEVIKAVEGLRGVPEIHRAEVFGLVDDDGMCKGEKEKLEKKGIYPLPVFSVESLLYSEEVQSAVALKQSNTYGEPHEEMLDKARIKAIECLGYDDKRYLASRLAERQLRDDILSKIPGHKQLREGQAGSISIQIESPYQQELDRLENLVGKGDIFGIIARYPVRDSKILKVVAGCLGCKGRDQYEQAALNCIRMNNDLRDVLKMKLGQLASQLSSQCA